MTSGDRSKDDAAGGRGSGETFQSALHRSKLHEFAHWPDRWPDVYPTNVRLSIKRLEQANPANVQEIAASQLELLATYHQIALAQSRRSFWWALVGSGIGLVFFIAAVALALMKDGVAISAVISGLSGAIVEAVAGSVFVLYGRTTMQLSDFHSRL
jgi:uncharacterized membrane protein